MGDIDGTVRAGGFASYRLGWLTLSSSVLSDVGGKDQGTIASFDAEFAYRPTPRLSFTAGPGLMWADDKYLQTYFGVNADQAARSGYSQFAPESGAAIIRLNLGAQYELTKHWGVERADHGVTPAGGRRGQPDRRGREPELLRGVRPLPVLSRGAVSGSIRA